MHSCIAILLLILFALQAHAKELPAKSTRARDSIDNVVDSFGWRLKASPIHNAELDDTVLGKPGHVAMQPRTGLSSLPMRSSHPTLPRAAPQNLRVVRAMALRPPSRAAIVRVAQRKRTEKAARMIANPEVKRLMEMAERIQSKEKTNALRDDPELKPFFDRMDQGGVAVMMKYLQDPEFLHKLDMRLGGAPAMRMEEAQRAMADPEVHQQMAAALAMSNDMREKAKALREDPELRSTFDKMDERGLAFAMQYYNDTAFMGKVCERLDDEPELCMKEAQRVAAVMSQSKDMQEKMRALGTDPELKAMFNEMTHGTHGTVMKYLKDPVFLRKVGDRLSNHKDPVKVNAPHLVSDETAATPLEHSELNTARSKVVADQDDNGRLLGTLLMLTCTMLWGTNFPAVKATMEAGVPTSIAAASRFTVAALALLPMLGNPRSVPPKLVKGGLECGAWIALGYIAQALALRDLPAGAVAFIVTLQVIFVPLAQALRGNGSFTPRLALAAFSCVAGVGLLESGNMGGAAGDVDSVAMFATMLALIQPVAFGISTLINKDMMQKFPDKGPQLASLQLISNAAGAIAFMALDAIFNLGGGASSGFDLGVLQQHPEALGGIMYTGLISTAFTIPLQMSALGKLPAADSTMIVSTEPLWAAFFASLMLGEHLDSGAMMGGAMIMLGCLANNLLPKDLGTGIGADSGAGILRSQEQSNSAGPGRVVRATPNPKRRLLQAQ